MIKNNNKLVLVAFLLVPLFTSGIAVGGMPNAYAGGIVLSVSMDCVADPPNTEIDFTYVISNLSQDSVLVDWQISGDFSDTGNQSLPSGESITDSFSVPGFSATASISVEVFDAAGNSIIVSDEDMCEFFLPPPIILVDVDVKPQSCPNPINTNSRGVIPVAILGSDLLDVSEIDVSTIQLEGVSPIKHDIEDVASPLLVPTELDENSCTADGPDGFDDLTLKFDAQEVIAALGPVEKGDVISVELEGELLNGITFEGYDIIIIK